MTSEDANLKHLVLDINACVDICLKPQRAKEFIAKSHSCGITLWLYVGFVDDLIQKVVQALSLQSSSSENIDERARKLLADLEKNTQWLSALPFKGSVFQEKNPGLSQFLSALDCFEFDEVAILSDAVNLNLGNVQTLSLDAFINLGFKEAKMPFINLPEQQNQIRSKVERGIRRILNHGAYIKGPEVRQLEKELAEYVGVEHCIACSNGTDGLQLALMTLGIGPEDEVITSAFSFFATAESIVILGAKPIFIDIDPLTYNMDPSLLEKAITPRTKAIIPVSLYGQCSNMSVINAIAEKHNLPVVEDAAQSFGATHKGDSSCSLSDIGVTSFFPSKPLGGYGDGGACFTDDPDLAKTLRQISDHGQASRYHHTTIGINARLDSFQATVLLAKMTIFEDERKRRKDLGGYYTERIQKICPELVPMSLGEGNTCVYAQYTVRSDNRKTLQQKMSALEIPTTVHYPSPMNQQPALRIPSNVPQAEKASQAVVSLPMCPYMGKSGVDRVVKALRQCI